MQYLTLRLLATLSFLATCSLSADLPLSPDAERRPGVPAGKIEKFTWTSRIFPGTVRDYWVYVPAQYKPDTPAAVMVFQDGGGFVNDKGRFRVPIVFDNLIHAGDMPVTIAIFINPGTLPALDSTAKPRDNRSYEYDSLGDRYARFLIEEILPEVGKGWNLTSDPNLRALAGNSSGGICSFTVAWERRDQFRRVLSTIGSFTDLRGGDVYPSLVRKMEPKPIRVYLQDNDHDLNIFAGDWPLANQQMVSALTYAGYDFKFVPGQGGHDSNTAGAAFPDALRWLWRDWQKPLVVGVPTAGDANRRAALADPAGGWTAAANPESAPQPNLQYSADRSLLFVSDHRSRWVWSHQVQPDGNLANGEPFYRLETADESSETGAGVMTVDTEGFLYVDTRLGIQACDPSGRVVAILAKPVRGPATHLSFTGAARKQLAITIGGKTWVRPMLREGVPPGQAVKPPAPRP
ncbi:MAG: alpha/beta hydrolase-fold protein [Bryobacteraceae bacterium]